MIFKPYEAKPVTRMAFQITPEHIITRNPDKEASYHIVQIHSEDSVVTSVIEFKAYEEPKVGDWVVRLTPEDTYHCTDAVFMERNIVPEGE
jgi:hypothetical protein